VNGIVDSVTIPFTIFRPSAFAGDRHRAPRLDFMRRVPGLVSYASIGVDELARAILRAAASRGPLDTALEGRTLFELVERAS
jgi:hypothetical protein